MCIRDSLEVDPKDYEGVEEIATVDQEQNLIAVLTRRDDSHFQPSLNFSHYWSELKRADEMKAESRKMAKRSKTKRSKTKRPATKRSGKKSDSKDRFQ